MTLKVETAETALWEIEPVISFFFSFSFSMKDALLLLLVWENIACWRCTFALLAARLSEGAIATRGGEIC